ncbi:sel1 repeat family protein [Selenomonas caprae]|uniref:Sel1 repeat family protein n=1 Tax=Selenomonas caprae TaxID=2606905 RepID=A0A5D6WKW3_9FIRM|nr:tetratricopeptide repeat protein [Selenomonas caprae]TYZ27064.1 sel1 repeat family protein [Selenomonas caprae]
MDDKFQPIVQEAVDLIWKHNDSKSCEKGQAMLRRAADDGDAESWALLSLTYLGKPWIGENGNVGTDMAEAEHCLKKSLSEGSPVGLLAILARRGLYPTEELDFWDYWADEKETAVAEMEEYTEGDGNGEGLAAYLLGMAYLRGGIDILTGKRLEKRERRQFAKTFMERARAQGIKMNYNPEEMSPLDDSDADWRLKLWLQNGMAITFDRYDAEEFRAALEIMEDTYKVIELYHDEDYLSVRQTEEYYELHAMLNGKGALRREPSREQVLCLLRAWFEGKTDISSEGWQNDDRAVRYVKWQRYLDKAEVCKNRDALEEMVTAFRQAANMDCGKAMVRLGCYHQEKGEKDAARQWFLRAIKTEAHDDVKDACYYLGCLEDGPLAVQYFEKAAKMGVAAAWTKLGNCYRSGLGTLTNTEKAMTCYKKGADLGDYEALYVMASSCRGEDGTWQDIPKAIACLRKVLSEENDWQNEARLLLAQVFMAQNPGKNSSRIESLLVETKYDKYFPGWLELAHYYKAHGRIYQYGQEMDALIKAGYEPAIKEKEDMYRGSEWSELF